MKQYVIGQKNKVKMMQLKWNNIKQRWYYKNEHTRNAVFMDYRKNKRKFRNKKNFRGN